MLQIYLNFKTEASQAIEFYEKVFQTTVVGKMTYGEAPANTEQPLPEDVKNLIMNAALEVEGTTIMFSDVPDVLGVPLHLGNNISLVLNVDSEEKIDRFFHSLSEGGQITMPLAETFWAKKYGTLVDKFGISWMLNWEKQQKSFFKMNKKQESFNRNKSVGL